MDFVYICKPGDNEELRYSIRSVLYSFPDARIYVVGGKPKWYSGNYIFVDQKHHKYANAINNLQAICDSNDILEEFLLMNDDTEIETDFIAHLVKGYNSLPVKDAVLGCLSLTLEEPKRITFSGIKDFIPWRWKSILYHKPFELYPKEGLTGVHESKFLPGRGMFFSRLVFF
jgi:hypothetical protein